MLPFILIPSKNERKGKNLVGECRKVNSGRPLLIYRLSKRASFAKIKSGFSRSQDYLEEALNETDIHLLPCSPNSASSKDPKLSFGDRPDPTRLSKRSVDGGANYVEVRSCYADERLNWTMFEQGLSITLSSGY